MYLAATYYDTKLKPCIMARYDTVKNDPELPLFKDCLVTKRSKDAVKLQKANNRGQLFAKLGWPPSLSFQIKAICEVEQTVIL